VVFLEGLPFRGEGERRGSVVGVEEKACRDKERGREGAGEWRSMVVGWMDHGHAIHVLARLEESYRGKDECAKGYGGAKVGRWWMVGWFGSGQKEKEEARRKEMQA
jgi:hypothetical protein